jgi:apolipoprotein N-acyltransferase
MIVQVMNTSKSLLLAITSGLLLTGAFPKIGWDWLIWFALLPLLYGLKDLSPRPAFRMGFITGLFKHRYCVFACSCTGSFFCAVYNSSGSYGENPVTLPPDGADRLGGPGIFPVLHLFGIPLGIAGLLPV